jgi:hypothetical protein
MIEYLFVGFEDPVRQPIVTHELPDVLDRIELGTFRWQRDERDVGRYDEAAREMPAGLIEDQHGMGARRDLHGDFGEVQVHRLGVAVGQDERCAFAVLRADGAENIGRGGALIGGGRGPRSTLCPAPGDFVLLADTRFVGEPDLYALRRDVFFARDFIQARGKVPEKLLCRGHLLERVAKALCASLKVAQHAGAIPFLVI